MCSSSVSSSSAGPGPWAVRCVRLRAGSPRPATPRCRGGRRRRHRRTTPRSALTPGPAPQRVPPHRRTAHSRRRQRRRAPPHHWTSTMSAEEPTESIDHRGVGPVEPERPVDVAHPGRTRLQSELGIAGDVPDPHLPVADGEVEPGRPLHARRRRTGRSTGRRRGNRTRSPSRTSPRQSLTWRPAPRPGHRPSRPDRRGSAGPGPLTRTAPPTWSMRTCSAADRSPERLGLLGETVTTTSPRSVATMSTRPTWILTWISGGPVTAKTVIRAASLNRTSRATCGPQGARAPRRPRRSAPARC